MKKKVTTLLLSVFLAVSAVCAFAGCGTGEVIQIKGYTAEEAYNSGRLIKDDIACALYIAYGKELFRFRYVLRYCDKISEGIVNSLELRQYCYFDGAKNDGEISSV